jgi:hypothetical protein
MHPSTTVGRIGFSAILNDDKAIKLQHLMEKDLKWLTYETYENRVDIDGGK